MMKVYIGIDVGTTSLKALALNEKGECLAAAKSSYDLFANGAEATQSADDWYSAAVTVIRKLTETVKAEDVCAISRIASTAAEYQSLAFWVASAPCASSS